MDLWISLNEASKDTLKASFPSPQYAHNIYNDNSKNFNVDPKILDVFASAYEKNHKYIPEMNEHNLNME